MDTVAKANKNGVVPVLLFGTTGTGKSSSAGIITDEETKQTISLGLPPEKTVILNTEEQPLPIENFDEFTNIYVQSHKQLMTIFDLFIQVHETPIEELQDKLDVEVEGLTLRQVRNTEFLLWDSLTSSSEQIETFAAIKYGKTWDKWAEYNELLTSVLTKMKRLPVQTFVLGIPEINPNDPDLKKFFKIKGNDRKFGGIEKEFVVVMCTHPMHNEYGITESIILDYRSNKFNTAKSPGGMFAKGIPNDLFLVANHIKKFYGKPLHRDERRENPEELWVAV